MATILRWSKGTQFFDDNGAPLNGGKLYYDEAGTTNDQATYSDADGLFANTNPVVLSSAGRLQSDVYLGSVNDYKETLTTSADVTISEWPVDDIPKAESAAAAIEFAKASFAWVSKSSTSTLLPSEFLGAAISGDTGSGSVTLTLPDASAITNGRGGIIRKAASANTLTIETQAAQTINGGASLVLTAQYDAWLIISDASNWRALQFVADGVIDSDHLAATFVTGLTATTTVDRTADYLLLWDNSDSANRKVLPKYIDRRLPDALHSYSVIDKDLTTAPVSPSEGDSYIVAAGASGSWNGQDGKIATYFDSAWLFYAPDEGVRVWVDDENKLYIYNGSAWVSYAETLAIFGLTTPFGAKLAIQYAEEEVTLSGATTDATFTFPNQSLACGVSIRVTELVTASGGGVSFSVGDSGSAGRYGTGFAFAAGTTGQGVIGPTGKYGSDNQVRFTVDAGSFTAGKVRLAAWYMVLTPPTS